MSENKEITDNINALKNGDERAFKFIYELYERRLFSFIIGYTKDELKAEGIVQDAFIKLWDKRETLNPQNSVKSYLFKTAYNVYIDKLRRRESELRMLDDWRYKRIMDAIEEDDEVRHLRIEKVRNAIDELPKRCKEVFLLCKYEGFKYTEISEVLGISTKTVQAQMVKAYKLIRENLKNSNLFLFIGPYLNKRFLKSLPF